ncbi:hypothetical protein SAMN05444392_11463 [Seinonella peptonophila]|uniref:Uncharacterized protein n=1 Tax=Seinonella peptonophila TaxID=112248 RepID=A0A1M5AKN7_9BACL|nr:hypothetical protein SAMN05444392_11463 [Seinonella peptonophila]
MQCSLNWRHPSFSITRIAETFTPRNDSVLYFVYTLKGATQLPFLFFRIMFQKMHVTHGAGQFAKVPRCDHLRVLYTSLALLFV